MMNIEEINRRIEKLKKERDQLIAEVNFRLGAIAELEKLKTELQKTKQDEQPEIKPEP